MIDLTETQRSILAAAAVRSGMRVLPLPDRNKGGAAKKVLDAMLARGLVTETAARDSEPTYRDGVALIATAAAFYALGITAPADETSDAEQTASGPAPTMSGELPADIDNQPASCRTARPRLRDGTMQAKMIAMLRSPDGATIDGIVVATGWQPHTVRGAISGALKKRLGLVITPRQSSTGAGACTPLYKFSALNTLRLSANTK